MGAEYSAHSTVARHSRGPLVSIQPAFRLPTIVGPHPMGPRAAYEEHGYRGLSSALVALGPVRVGLLESMGSAVPVPKAHAQDAQ